MNGDFLSQIGLYEKKNRSNFSLVQTSGDWKLEFQSKIWNPAYL